MFNIGTGELLVIALVALIVLGPDKLPKAARQVGQFTSEARKIANGFRHEMKQAMDEVAQTADPRDDRDPERRLTAPPAGAVPIDTPPADSNGANGPNGANGAADGPTSEAATSSTTGANGSSPAASEPDDPAARG